MRNAIRPATVGVAIVLVGGEIEPPDDVVGEVSADERTELEREDRGDEPPHDDGYGYDGEEQR